MKKNPSFDAYSPLQMAERVRAIGVQKANLDTWSLVALSVLAGAFIAIGGAFSTLSVTSIDVGFGLTRLLAGLTFSLGLLLVVTAGAELFTGNNLVVMAWASGKVTLSQLLRNWGWALAGNFVGAVATAVLMVHSGVLLADDGKVGASAISIALAKVDIGFADAFVRGVLCNALVCLAVWLSFSARTTSDKALAIVGPITAFVALGFEHSIANMYFIPLAILLKSQPEVIAAGGFSPEQLAGLSWASLAKNLIPVTLGNVVGGGVLVAGIYWFIYLRPRSASEPE